MAHRAAQISVSLVVSQTPAYTARARIRGVPVYSPVVMPVPRYTAW